MGHKVQFLKELPVDINFWLLYFMVVYCPQAGEYLEQAASHHLVACVAVPCGAAVWFRDISLLDWFRFLALNVNNPTGWRW